MADEKYRLENHTAAELDELLTKLGELYDKEELDELIAAKADQTALDELETAMNTADAAIVARGSKNLLKNTAVSAEINGVTFTVNSDGSITATGTATANADFTLSNLTGYPTSGRYVLSGCPEGGGANTYRIQIYQVAADYGEGVAFVSQNRLNVYIRISAGQTVDNLVFKPMIRPAEIPDSTYQPYAPSNRELFEGIEPILTAFPMMLRRGTATMNSDSGFGFDDIHETIYYRYTASAIGNPVSGAYGIILTFAFTSYIVQVLFSNTSSTSCELRYRFSADTGGTWRPWHLVTATPQS
ncbi:MAG: hypothetical protein J6M48_06300 [Ruminococcus sp.]|nr:hypothetical protein [Ruminococcus sp.]